MRVQFDLTDEAVDYVDRIKDRSGAVSRAEVLRNSIAALQWLVEKAGEGYAILAVKAGEDVAKELSMPILQNVASPAASANAVASADKEATVSG